LFVVWQIDNLVGISNEIARITDRGAAFVEKIEGGSSSTGGADTPFVNPATNPTKETSSPAPDSTVPTDDTSAADAVAANEKKKEKETTTIIVSIVVTLLVVGVLFGAMFCFLKRRSNAVPHQKLSSGPDDLEDNRMEMTVPSSNRRLTLGGGEANIDQRSRFELDRKKTKVGSIEVRDNPMNLLHESSTKHDEYQYDDDKIEQSKEQGSVAAVATVVGTGDLPEGWLSNLDEDGDEYWYNHDLGESTYDRPT
jgi:flagellar basal body-associated protein FliL